MKRKTVQAVNRPTLEAPAAKGSAETRSPEVESLGSIARGGAKSQMAAQITEFALGLGVLVYLAHLLDASTFGVVSLAIALTGVVSTVVTSPVTRAVIALGYTSQRTLSTAWWAAAVPSTVIAIMIIGATAAGFRGKELIAISVVAGSMPLVACSTLVQAILQQRLEFRAAATGRMVAALGSSIVAVSFAAGGSAFGGLLARSATAPFLVLVLGLIQARWRPRLVVDRPTLGAIRAYAWGIAGFSLLNQLNRYSDNLLVGFFLGSSALGYYALAYRFIETPVYQVGSVGASVVFPTLARIDDPDRFRDALLRSQKVLVWIIAPLGICSIAVGDIAVRIVLGERWVPAGIIVQIFGAVALLQAAGTQVGVIYLARDATAMLMRWACFATPVVVGSFAIGLLGGVRGVAWAYLAANLILFHPSWQFPGRLIALTGGMVVRNLSVVLGLAFALAACVLAVRSFTPVESPQALASIVVALTVVYWTASAFIDNELRNELRKLLVVGRSRDRSTPDLSAG